MGEQMLVVGGVVGVGSVLLIALGSMFAKMYRKVDQGRALIINKMRGEPEVTFTGGVVLPDHHRAESWTSR
jgi:flotillin